MANLKTKTKAFFCCFGVPDKESHHSKILDKTKTVGLESHRSKKLTLRLSLSGFREKSMKTVPVMLDGATGAEKQQRSGELRTIYYWLKPRSKSNILHGTDPKLILIHPEKRRSKIQPVLPDQTPLQITNPGGEKKINLDSRKSSGNSTCQKRLSFTKKIDAIRARSTKPGSPVEAKPARPLRQSESFPAGPVRVNPRPAPKKTEGPTARPGRRLFEPVVGMSVVIVTLVILVVWGRLCAVLCTSAWLYFVPRLSSVAAGPNGDRLGAGSGSDLGSEESKKKVVREGFLERGNHRHSL